MRLPTRAAMNLARIPAQRLNTAYQYLYRLLDSGESIIRYYKKTDCGLHVTTLRFYQPTCKLSSYLIGVHLSVLFKNETAVVVLKQYW